MILSFRSLFLKPFDKKRNCHCCNAKLAAYPYGRYTRSELPDGFNSTLTRLNSAANPMLLIGLAAVEFAATPRFEEPQFTDEGGLLGQNAPLHSDGKIVNKTLHAQFPGLINVLGRKPKH